MKVASYPTSTHSLTNFRLEQRAKNGKYKWFQMSKNVSLNKLIPKNVVYNSLLDDVKIKLSVSNGLNGTTNSDIPVRMKKFSYNGTENKVILCGKAYYLPAKQEKDFQFWVELTRLQGYEKIVIFNNSIENTPTSQQVFSNYKDFVQVVQYQCLPNFIHKKLKEVESPKFIDFNYIKNQLKFNPLALHIFFERMTQNECYWENKDKYKHIAVLDIDESVIPKILDNHFEAENLKKREVNLNKLIKAENKCAKSSHDLQSYFIQLQNGLSKRFKSFFDRKIANRTDPVLSYHFHTAFYPQYELVDYITEQIAIQISSVNSSVNGSSIIRVPVHHFQGFNVTWYKLNFTILISNSEELAYAKYLIELWKSVIKPFVRANKNAFDNLTFSRLFFFEPTATPGKVGNKLQPKKKN